MENDDRRAAFERVVRDIHDVYRYRNAPGYRDINGYFSKDWRLWTPQDLSRLEPDTVRVLYSMNQWGYNDLLAQVLPDYYREHGGCAAYAQDLGTVYRGGSVQAARMGYHPDNQPAHRTLLNFDEPSARGATTTQASLDAIGQLARNAGVILHPTSEVLPVALRGVGPIKQVAA